MKICFKDLCNIANEKRYDVKFDVIEPSDKTFLYRLEDVEGHVTFYYDFDDKLCIKYHVEGTMICPDSFTFEEIEHDYMAEDEDFVTYKEDEEGFYLYDNMELSDFVMFISLPEVPIIVENPNKKRYYSGDGWTISSEEEYNRHSKEVIDPRLAKLLEYKEE